MAESVKMHWWDGRPNFGDLLNPLLVKKLFGIEVVHEADPLRADLIGIGSQWNGRIIGERDKLPATGLHVWGTGFYGSSDSVQDGRLIPHLVRGHHTAALFPDFTGAVGDAGLLSNTLVEKPVPKRYEVGVMCHWKELGSPAVGSAVESPRRRFINVLQPPQDVVAQVAACDGILSSSLHGLIVADSLGVPNTWVTFSGLVDDQRVKFADYYSVHDIQPEPVPVHPGQPLPLSGLEEYSRPKLEQIRHDIVTAFPDFS